MSPIEPHSTQNDSPSGRARQLLLRACEDQRAGRMREAAEGFAAAVDEGHIEGDRRAVVEALRRLGVLHHLRSEPRAAHDYTRQSLMLARRVGDDGLAAEALNVLAGFASEAGEIVAARQLYHEALEAAGGAPHIAPRVEQNLGMLANIQGDLDDAIAHYRRALAGYADLRDEQGCAMVHHNLGMLCADRSEWQEAHGHFTECHRLARAVGDLHLEATCTLNHCEVYLAQERFDESRRDLQAALDIFDRLDCRGAKADAYRMLGVVDRETGRMALAESRLRSAAEIAASAGAPLSEGEACLELARLYQRTRRTHEALRQLRRARGLFERLGARVELSAVDELERQLAA